VGSHVIRHRSRSQPRVRAVGAFGNATRSWTDTNKNFVPDCVLTSLAANGECGALSDINFGTNNVSTLLGKLSFDPNLQTGWGQARLQLGIRVSVQQELTPRLFARRGLLPQLYGNFQVADNLALSASDFNLINITYRPTRVCLAAETTRSPASPSSSDDGFGGFVNDQNVVKLSDDVGGRSSITTA